MNSSLHKFLVLGGNYYPQRCPILFIFYFNFIFCHLTTKKPRQLGGQLPNAASPSLPRCLQRFAPPPAPFVCENEEEFNRQLGSNQALEMLIRIDLDGDMKKKKQEEEKKKKEKLCGGVIAVTALSVGLIQGVVNINAGCPSGMARWRQLRDCSWGGRVVRDGGTEGRREGGRYKHWASPCASETANRRR